MSVKFALAIALTVSFFSPAWAELRTHFVVASRDHTPAYYVTTITSGGEAAGIETYLFESVTGKRVTVVIRRDYKSHFVVADYTLGGGKAVRVTLHLPGRSSSRSETLNEYREHAELRAADIPVTLEAGGKQVKTSEKEWNGAGARAVRERVEAVVGADVVAVLRPMASVFGFPPFGGACSTYPFVAGGMRCGGTPSMLIATIRPDCDFDAKFERPCDAAQQLRAKQQPRNSRVGVY